MKEADLYREMHTLQRCENCAYADGWISTPGILRCQVAPPVPEPNDVMVPRPKVHKSGTCREWTPSPGVYALWVSLNDELQLEKDKRQFAWEAESHRAWHALNAKTR